MNENEYRCQGCGATGYIQTRWCATCGGMTLYLCPDCNLKHHPTPPAAPAFGQNMRQPDGFNPPPLELRSPEPEKGQLL